MQRAILTHPVKLWLIKTDLTAADGWDWTKMSPGNNSVSFPESQYGVIYSTNPRSTLDDRIEHRLHVCRRAADDTEHLGGCRLMLQSLAQFCVALLDLLEQPDVLDSDYGLVSEGLQQADLLIRERADFYSA